MADKSRPRIYLTYGKKGSGKSLAQAKEAFDLKKEYTKMEKKYPKLPKRILLSNQKFSNEMEKHLAPNLYYWQNFAQLKYCPRKNCWRGKEKHPVHDADIQHDEISKDFPAGGWQDTPRWVKVMFSHLRKRGNRYFANCQKYEDIDISFRRQIDHVYISRKVFGSREKMATRPPVKHLWGLIIKKELDPDFIEHEPDPKKRAEDAVIREIAEWFFIRKKYVKAYDTQAELPAYKPDTLSHREQWCEDPQCPRHGKENPKGRPKLIHQPI